VIRMAAGFQLVCQRIEKAVPIVREPGEENASSSTNESHFAWNDEVWSATAENPSLRSFRVAIKEDVWDRMTSVECSRS
jgi:hypothetical protein